MNHTLSKRPDSSPTTVVFGAPSWLVMGLRCVLAVMSCVAAALSSLHWSGMPWAARLLVAFLAPALVAWSIWPRPWRRVTKFIADDGGMYFAAHSPLMVWSKPRETEEWLQVPWPHIDNIRLAREAGEDGHCVAFDLQVTTTERSRFFAAVGTPRDRRDVPEAGFTAAYGGWPPSPAQVVEQLKSLRLRSGLPPGQPS
jgi:hypothetical protein